MPKMSVRMIGRIRCGRIRIVMMMMVRATDSQRRAGEQNHAPPHFAQRKENTVIHICLTASTESQLQIFSESRRPTLN